MTTTINNFNVQICSATCYHTSLKTSEAIRLAFQRQKSARALDSLRYSLICTTVEYRHSLPRMLVIQEGQVVGDAEDPRKATEIYRATRQQTPGLNYKEIFVLLFKHNPAQERL